MAVRYGKMLWLYNHTPQCCHPLELFFPCCTSILQGTDHILDNFSQIVRQLLPQQIGGSLFVDLEISPAVVGCKASRQIQGFETHGL